jgi:hypothetical protein
MKVFEAAAAAFASICWGGLGILYKKIVPDVACRTRAAS